MSDAVTEDKTDRDKWLLLLLLITAADIEAAKQLWIDHAPRAFRGVPLDDGFTYDRQRLVYVAAHGPDVSNRDVKRLSLILALALAHDLQKQAQYVADGTVPVEEWRAQAASTIKDLFIAQAALAAGGFDRLTPEVQQSLIGSVDSKFGLAFSLDRLWKFGDAIATRELGADGAGVISRRAGLYADAANPVAEKVRRQEAIAARDSHGRPLFLFERNVLTPGENCADGASTEGCTEVTAQEWQPIGSLPDIGDRTCSFRCKCSWEFSLLGDLSEQPSVTPKHYDPGERTMMRHDRAMRDAVDAMKSIGSRPINVHVDAPIVNVELPEQRPLVRQIIRNEVGRISEIRDEPAPLATPG